MILNSAWAFLNQCKDEWLSGEKDSWAKIKNEICKYDKTFATSLVLKCTIE